ncbi:unnamed protein product [Albugo candida]|uniref:Uncharacterized protein n=1 Tax=Albugo candida TaxID=65357 RepID=A0A024FUE2_9STRA|nr:unnamed protein product [Albugo candida]|eukprot:CCI10778.1 unnamed protein product [Albugo candida]
MSPNESDSSNDVLRDDNSFYWKVKARMRLARKDLLDTSTELYTQKQGRYRGGSLESERLESVFHPIVDAQHSIPVYDQEYDIDEAALGYINGFFCSENFTQESASATSVAGLQDGKRE